MKISLIGLGSSGIFCLKRLASHLNNKRFEMAITSITIYTDKNEFITGHAFASHHTLNDAFLLNTRSSLLDQLFPNWQVCV